MFGNSNFLSASLMVRIQCIVAGETVLMKKHFTRSLSRSYARSCSVRILHSPSTRMCRQCLYRPTKNEKVVIKLRKFKLKIHSEFAVTFVEFALSFSDRGSKIDQSCFSKLRVVNRPTFEKLN